MIRRPARLARSGFVLPTTALLVLMVLLTATALTYRSFTRSDQAITQREQQVIVNSATPAIDRAKAKIEFLFQNDPRFPSGVPASDILSDLMANERQASKDDDDRSWAGYTQAVPLLATNDPYTLPDETRVNINGGLDDANADELDNAWMFRSDINGDGVVDTNEIIVYSILVDDVGPEDVNPNDPDENPVPLQEPDDKRKADALVTRTGPLATTQATASCGGAIAEGGWQIVQAGNTSTLQKNFQVNVFVANTNEGNQTFESMEFQQSRVAARASKWGAWFRYDLEIHPGQDFNWNGAMHTDGNLVLWGQIDAFLVSSPSSCVYSRRASEITLGQFDYDDNGLDIYNDSTDPNSPRDFQGQVMAAKTDGDAWGSNDMEMHIFNGLGTAPITDELIDETNDSVDPLTSNPSDVAMNPLVLFAQDKATHIDTGTEESPLWRRDADWDDTAEDGNPFRQADQERTYNDLTAKPFVDDFFRADDRWGPKPRYEDDDAYDMTADNNGTNDFRTGVEIAGSGLDATIEDQVIGPTEGLDGYWERQAIDKGLRLIVGERLELGNPNTWGFDPTDGSIDPRVSEALYPHNDQAFVGGINGRFGGPHERLHRKALRDNLAAVQTMAVYHYQGGGTNGMATDGEFPLACYALTAHPGTEQSIIDSRTFENYTNTGELKLDFLNGKGTNGWEFSYPAAFNFSGVGVVGGFDDEIAAGQPLGDALRNLAYFAGDPNGGAPSFEVTQGVVNGTTDLDGDGVVDDEIHPYPYMSMWGDFSTLRRVLAKIDSGTSYNDLSFADKSTLHTAACTVSVLAYNIEQDYAEVSSVITGAPTSVQNVTQQLAGAVETVMDCMEGGSCKSGSFNADELLDSLGYYDLASSTPTWVDLNPDTELSFVDDDGDTVTICPANGGTADQADFQANCDSAEFFADWSLNDWVELMSADGAIPSLDDTDDDANGIPDVVDDVIAYAESLNTYTDVTRDRDLGFVEGLSEKAGVPYDPESGAYVDMSKDGFTQPVAGFGKNNNVTRMFQINCNPNIFQDWGAQGGGGQDNVVSAGLVVCADMDLAPVRYPSLYYLFPVNDHGHAGAGYHLQPDGTYEQYGIADYDEEYIIDGYISDTGINGNVSTVEYKIVGADDIEGIFEIAAVPKATDMSDWVIPATTPAVGTLDDPDETDQAFRIAIGSTNVANVAFLDKGVFDGREMLNTRVLDIDLDALTTDTPSGDSGLDYWLSADLENEAKGVVYAFREDAVREDEIVRPRNATATFTPAYCMQVNKTAGFIFRLEREAGCLMNADPDNAQDPPLTVDKISLKPVDFAPEPERRPHGFRLRTASRNPADFSGGDPAADDARMAGMTFVTDNSVYIMGNFNPHSDDPTDLTNNLLEEFTQTLNANYNNFYTRNTLNTGNFANLEVDHWRPVEILSDGITVLSRNFVDGAVEDSFTRNTPSSYTNQTGPDIISDDTDITAADVATGNWVHSAFNDDGTPNLDSPVWIDRNGVFYLAGGAEYYDTTAAPFDDNDDWIRIQDNKQLQASGEDTYINATFVSGITPKRGNQGYGGLHNFPRFLQDWNTDLFISGSFIQLNFSTASTGPFEQEGLEPGTLPVGAEWIRYYGPPDRRWGYDVGLLYVPPAPAAERFVDIESPRSEYYREVATDDAYIVNLRCAVGDVNEDGTVGADEYIYSSEAVRGTCPNDQ